MGEVSETWHSGDREALTSFCAPEAVVRITMYADNDETCAGGERSALELA